MSGRNGMSIVCSNGCPTYGHKTFGHTTYGHKTFGHTICGNKTFGHIMQSMTFGHKIYLNIVITNKTNSNFFLLFNHFLNPIGVNMNKQTCFFFISTTVVRVIYYCC